MRLNHAERIINKEISRSDIPDIIKGRTERFVFPFEISLGTINNSELGEATGNITPANFSQYSRVFTGKDNVILTWKGSTTCSKPSEEADYLVKEFTTGEAIATYIDTQTTATQTTATGADADFATQEAVVRVSAVVEGAKFNYNDIFIFWYIPGAGTIAWFEIEQIITYFDKEDKEVLLQEVSFSSVNDKLASSGQSIEQFLQKGAPGEGYAWPIENLEERTYDIDESKLLNNPITELQIELFGGGVFVAPIVMGRRVEAEDDDKITTPKLLFPYKLQVPVPSEVSKTTGGENNYYFIPEARIDVISYYDDWKENFRENYDFTVKRNYEGVLETNRDEVLDTNNEATKTDIYDETWSIPTGSKEIDTTAIPYFKGDSIRLGELMKVPELFTLGALAFIDTNKLPISITETLIWSSKDIPIVGGFLNLLSLGVPWGGSTTSAKIAAKAIFGFIPATLYDFSETALQTDGAGAGNLPLDIFRNDTGDSVSGAIGSNSVSTIFKFSLTDKVQQGETIRDTKDLGQKEENGGWTFGELIDDGENEPYYEFTERTASPGLTTFDGFVIDYIGFKAIAKLDYKWTAYRHGYPLFQVKKQTRSKFTEATREWDNGMKMSNWNEKDGNTVNYPEEIIPKPPQSGYGDITYEINSTYSSNDRFSSTEIEASKKFTFDLADYETTSWEDAKIKWNSIDINIGTSKNFYANGDFGYVYYGTTNASSVSKEIEILDVENELVEIYTNTTSGKGSINYTWYDKGLFCNRNSETIKDFQGEAINSILISRSGTKITATIKFNYLNPDYKKSECNSTSAPQLENQQEIKTITLRS